MERITSRDNRRLVRARKVRDGREPGSIFIEGKRLFEEAVRNEAVIDEVFVSESFASLNQHITASHTRVFLIPDVLLNSIADTATPQGIVAIAKRPNAGLLPDEIFQRKGGLPIWILLEAVQDPSNVGAVMRAAKAAGASGLILTGGSADPYSPKSLRASMGAAFGLPTIHGISVADVLEATKRHKIRIAATGVENARPHWDIDWKVPTLLMFGSEARGLSRMAAGVADIRVSIPMDPAVESLNVAVSCGVIVYEALRQIRC